MTVISLSQINSKISVLLLVALLSLPSLSAQDDTNPVVKISTELGDIFVELYLTQAPISAGNYLAYVEQGLFDNQSAFHRVVRPDNDRGTPTIGVVQAGMLPGAIRLPPITHETTKQTGIQHLDGTLSIARSQPGTGGAGEYFICVGDQPSLDFGGQRQADGQGFAAFGRVIAGMDLVRAIQANTDTRDDTDSYVLGQILTSPVLIKQVSLVQPIQ